MSELFLIEKRGLYYRPQSAGYTGLKSEAGRYSFDKAAIHAGPNGPEGSKDGMGVWRESEAPEYSSRCPWDVRVKDQSYRQGYADALAQLTQGGQVTNVYVRNIEPDDGFWKSCSGCHETNEGYETGHYPYSNVFKCYIGGGCRECGGIGAVWDNTDYVNLADYLSADTLPDPRIEGWNAAIEAAVKVAKSAQLKRAEGTVGGVIEQTRHNISETIRAIPCPYVKESDDDN